MLNAEPSNLVFMKTYNTEFEHIANYKIYGSKW